MTQLNIVKNWLKKYGNITALDCFHNGGGMRLAARVHDLRNEGWNIYSLQEDSYVRYMLVGLPNIERKRPTNFLDIIKSIFE